MDSAGNYGSGPVVHLGYNWQHSLATHYPYPPPPAIALMSSGDSYNPYSSQQMAPTPNNAALVSLPYPPTTVFGGQAPSVAVPTESLNHLRQALQKIQELPQMADPLSLMTSLIAVATAGVQVSRALYSIANVNGGSSEEIQSIGREISAFSGVLRDLHEFLDDAKGLISKRALLNADRILRNCKNVFANIQRMLESCSAGPRMNFWHSLQWSFRREKVKPMYAKLESFKLTLVILLSTLRLARCKQEIGNSKSPTLRRKEQRYRANLETDILNNSAAIIRWHRVEIEVKSTRNAHAYTTQKQSPATPSKELEWLSNLVPYKPPQPQIVASGFLPLPPIPETPCHLDEKEQVRIIIRAVYALLAKWTTLYSFEVRIRPNKSRNASQTSDGRRKPKPRSRTVEEPVGTEDADFAEASSSTTESSSSHHTTTVSNESESLEKPGNRHDHPSAESIRSTSNPIEPAPVPTADVEINKTGKEAVSERVTSRPNNIATEQPAKNSGDEGVSENDDDDTGGDDSTDGDEDEMTTSYEYDDLSCSETDHTESELSKASPNHSVAPSGGGYDYQGPRPAHLRHHPPLSSSSSDSCAPNPAPNIPQYQGSPYGTWPYSPPPNFPSPYSPGPYAPSPYNHMAYSLPPPTGYAQTMCGSPTPIAPVSYMNPPPPGIVPGPYPGFSSVLTPQPAPLANSHNHSQPKHRDQQVGDLEEKVESLKKDLELKDALDRKEKVLLEEKLGKQAGQRAKEEEAEPSASEKRKRDNVEDESSDPRIIRFEDALGRKFTFPYQQCKRWVDMEILIEQAFANIQNSTISGHVKRGRFDLSDPSGAVILPSIWETVVQPDWTITMHMWPLPEAALSEEPLSEETITPTGMRSSNKVPAPATPPPSPPSPSVPMVPSTTFRPRPRAPRSEAVAVVEENISRDSRRETDSETQSMSTDDDSDNSNLKSSFQEMLTESFGRHGQQFEETWEAVMAKSRVKAQKTILEMWLSASDAELRKLEASTSREQRTRELDQKTPVISTEIPEDSTNCGNGKSQVLKGLLRSDYTPSSGQKQPLSPSTGDTKGSTLCQSCQSQLLSSRLELQTPAANKPDSFRPPGGDSEPLLLPPLSPQHFPPRGTLEQRIEALEDFIKRKEADRQAQLEKAKAVENEQRLNRLEKAIVQADIQTPPSTPVMSETSPISPTNSSPRRLLRSQSGDGTVGNDGRYSFRKRLFSRSVPSSAIAS